MKRRDFLSGLAITSATLAAGQAAKSTDASQNKDAQQNLKVPRITRQEHHDFVGQRDHASWKLP